MIVPKGEGDGVGVEVERGVGGGSVGAEVGVEVEGSVGGGRVGAGGGGNVGLVCERANKAIRKRSEYPGYPELERYSAIPTDTREVPGS